MIEYTRTKGGGSRHPVFDTERFAHLQRSDRQRANAMLSILANVIANGCTPVYEARLAWDRKQPAQAAHVIHNLRGCVANLGGKRVHELASILEPKLEAGVDSEEARQLLGDLEQELAAFVEAAKRWLIESSKAKADASDHELEQRSLLASYLLDSNILACDVFDRLEPNLKDRMPASEFESLHRAMENLNFAQALVHLAGIK